MTKVIAAGMPASGKSTFIAALTHLLTAEQVPTELRLARLSEDEGHLSRLERAWLDATKLERTKASSEQWVSFFVEDTNTGVESELLVPDLRGELFAQPATVGRCERHLWEALIECDGLLLFTNANAGVDDMMVDQISHIVDIVSEADGNSSIEYALDSTAKEQKGPSVASKFRADDMPEETKLVELLQALNRFPVASKRRRLALVVSAWDVVSDADPAEWIMTHRPMLGQYLKHAANFWEVRFYGVSAQGGDLPEHEVKLKALRRPAERVQVIGLEVKPHDLTSIVKWVAANEDQRNA